MKSKITSVICICVLSISQLVAQQSLTPSFGGEVTLPVSEGPCLTEEHRTQIQDRVAQNMAQLEAEGRLQTLNAEGNHPLFIWPVAQASGFDYNSVWSVTNYVDHDPNFPNQISDYDCGTRSYDTTSGYNHQGFDIITWPFWWKQMDLNQGINVAAADGQIMDKNDGSFDRNCSFNSDIPNYIALQHADGSVSWYLHMKEGALTSKNVGDMVTEGEFLGVVGSSGSSTLPHLHFEVYDSANQLVDPSIGTCNDFNSDTWWVDQKPYYTPGINAALTHSTWADFATCPTTETTNESNQFDLGDDVYYVIYLKDQQAGTNVHLKITRPDNSIQSEWDFNLVDALQLSVWGWILPNDMEGEWTWEATYMGDTATHTYNVGVLGIEETALAGTQIYPNPVSKELNIVSNEPIHEVSIHDISGRKVLSQESLTTGIRMVEFPETSNGVFFVTLRSQSGAIKTIKIIKN